MKTNNVTKPTFILLASYLTQLEKLSREQRGDWITAILRYVNGEPLPEMDAAVDMFFSVAKEQVDLYNERWNQTREARRMAGSLGGKATARNRQAANAAFAAANEANQADNEYVYDNDVDNVYVNEGGAIPHSRKQTIKESRKGIERDTDYDQILLDQIRNRRSESGSGDSEDILASLGIPVSGMGR